MKSKAAGILILAALALAACWYFLPAARPAEPSVYDDTQYRQWTPAQLDSLWLECARMKKKP